MMMSRQAGTCICVLSAIALHMCMLCCLYTHVPFPVYYGLQGIAAICIHFMKAIRHLLELLPNQFQPQK
jgi:hypothetical protein